MTGIHTDAHARHCHLEPDGDAKVRVTDKVEGKHVNTMQRAISGVSVRFSVRVRVRPCPRSPKFAIYP